MAIQGSPSATYPFPVTLSWLRATLHNNLDSVSAVSNTVQCSHFRLRVTLGFRLMPSLPILESPVTTDLTHSDAVPEPLLIPSARSNLSLSVLSLMTPSFCVSKNWHCVSQTAVSRRNYSSSSWECKQLRESISEAYLWCVHYSIFVMCTCACWHTHATVHLWRSKGNLQESLSPSTSLRQGSPLSLPVSVPISP